MNKLGKYDLLEKIGAGGYGVVFKGYDPFIKRTVAIKTCNSDDERVRLRFYREAEIAGNLIHPNITTVYDFGIHDEVPYMVEEFLTGEDLEHKIKRRAEVPVAQRLDYLVQVARGLEYAHAQGVVHRDIKPGNIRVLDNDRAKIMDFGTAKLAHVDSGLTQAGMTLGTAAYISPEQIQGNDVGFAADIFSFGVTAFELLTYERPFDGRKIATVLHQILNEAPRTVTGLWPQCPPSLARFLERCLQKDPRRRFVNAGEALAELQAVIQDYVRDQRTAADETPTRFLAATPSLLPVDEAAGGAAAQAVPPSAASAPARVPAPAPPPPPPIAAPPPRRAAAAVTERPAPAPPPLPPPPPPPPVSQPAVAELVQRARALHDSREVERALLVASTAAAVAPADADVRQLVETVEQDLRAEVERERRRHALAQRLQEVAGLIENSELAAAADALTDLEREVEPRSGELLDLRFRLEEAVQRVRAEESGKALAKAEKQMDRGQYRAARATIEAALATDPGNPELATALAAAERLAQQGARRGGAAREDAVVSIANLIDRGRFEEAEQAITFARQMLGDVGDLDRLEREIVERRHLHARRKELAVKIEQAKQRAEQRDYPAALAVLLDVQQEDPEYPGLEALIRTTRQAMVAHDESRRRLQAVADATATIEGYVRRRELDRAEEALRFAEQHLEPFEPAARLRSLIAEERSQLERGQLDQARQALHARLRRAQQLLTSGEFGAAIRLLRQALEDDPENEEVEVMLRAAKEAQERGAEADRREQAIAEAAAGVEAHLTTGDLDSARQSVEFAIELLGPTSELTTLRKRVNQAELSATAVRSRVTRLQNVIAPGSASGSRSRASAAASAADNPEIEALLTIARELERSGQRAAARRTVEAALDLDADNPRALELHARLASA